MPDPPLPFTTRLTPPELVAGLAYGVEGATEFPMKSGSITPREAMTEVLTRALSRPPCVVSFSGGRDSSAMLALAVSVARDTGLDLPVPATLVFPNDAEADEESWQRQMIDHLKLTEWERVVITGDEVDAVGPIARDTLLRHGLLWPFNAHLHVPILRVARGGTLVTGFGGDELGNASAGRRAARILRSGPRRPEDLLVVGYALAPKAIRRAVVRGRYDRGAQLPWLTEAGRIAVGRMVSADEADERWRWDRLLPRSFLAGRYFRLCAEAFSTIGGDVDSVVVHPFVAAPVIQSLARSIGFSGAGSRESLMRVLFGDLLPETTLSRPTKASFTSPLWTETARTFAREWSGRSPAPGLVDPDRLRQAWLEDSVDVRSTSLLQGAWLIDNA